MSTSPDAPRSCCASPNRVVAAPSNPVKSWSTRYFAAVTILAVFWWLAYTYILPTSNWLVFKLFGFSPDSHAGLSLEFFIYDTVKILLLLVLLIYAIAWIRASMNMERVRDYLAGKRRGVGYFLGASFGAATPFCSCSSIPLFLGFTTARIPVGITMSFLITSPLINEIAVVLLWGILGWKFAVIYVAIGMAAGIIGGFVMDGLKAGRWFQPFILEIIQKTPAHQQNTNDVAEVKKLTVQQRHDFAYSETTSIFKRVWKWVFIGVGIGAALHGFVPDNWFAENLGAGEWWSVPVSVLVGIPLYSNVTGIIPIMESLLFKGLPVGTTMAFCMSAVAASLPEVMMLRQIMTFKLQAAFIGYLWVVFTLVGWLFNIVGPHIL
ncbi:permease [Alcaligenaceae bacterium]|nr:permease [Alcaligenaceae bacterium]